MRPFLLIVLMTTELIMTTIIAVSQTNSPRMGAAEKAMEKMGKEALAWPYPEPAEPGATGYSPLYSEFTDLSERWDIYINLLWRKTDPRNKGDKEYFDEEISKLFQTNGVYARRRPP